MSAPRYIEVTSAHRNRHNWPCPAEFVVPAACVNRGNEPSSARDQVVSGYPENAWFQVPYASPRIPEGRQTPRFINGIAYTSLWPLSRNPDNAANEGSGRIMAMKFSGGTSSAPALSSLLSNPPNVWLATNPPSPNPVLNPYFIPVSNYLTGAMLIKFKGDPSEELNSGTYKWNGSCESAIISAFDATSSIAYLSSPFSNDIKDDDFFLIDFNTDPDNGWESFTKGGPRIFIPNGSAGQNAYSGMYVQNYTWTKNGLDNNDNSGFARVTRYDSVRRIAYLDSPLPLVEQLVCAEDGNPDSFYGSNTFTLRDAIPTICRSLGVIGTNYGSIGEIVVSITGQNYKLGETIISGNKTDYFNSFYSSPGKTVSYEWPDYVLEGSGYGFVGSVTGVDALGGIVSLEILQQGAGFEIDRPYRLSAYTGESTLETRPGGLVRQKGSGQGCVIRLPQVYQSLEIHSRWEGDNMNTIRCGDFVYLPEIGQIKKDGTPNYSTDTTPPSMPRYAYTPSNTNKNCPITSFRNLDIRFSGYPSRVDCRPEDGMHIFPFSGTKQISKVFRKNWTFSPMWESRPQYPEEDAKPPIVVIMINGRFNLRESGLTDWGTPAYETTEALPHSGILREQDLEILQFKDDNEHALNYTGSTVSQNQMVCYAINLTSLTLPNIPLRNEVGGLIAFYPYVYVELSNVSAPSSGNRGILYSNNPNSNRALFRVTVDDQNTPLRSRFIKLDGGGAVQTVKFKPNDNLKFRVFLSNGLLFQTEKQDFAPPLHPDFFVQVGACFGIKRMV